MADRSSITSSQASTRTRSGLILLTWLALAWRVQGIDWQSLWRDEVDAIYFATRHLPDTLAMFVDPGQNGALYFITLRPWFTWVGSSEFALRYPSALAGALSIPLLWQVARRLLPLLPQADERRLPHALPWITALLLAAHPYQLWYGQEGKMYTWITALVLLATWWWLQGITRGGWRPWLAYTVTVSVGIYTHLLLILIFPLHFVWFWLAWPQSRHHWRGYGAALAGLTLPYLPMVWWQWHILWSSDRHTGFAFTPLDVMLRSLLDHHSRGMIPPDDAAWLTPLYFLGAAGILLGLGEIGAAPQARPTEQLAAWRRWAMVASWVAIPVLGIYLFSLRQPIFTERYVIWIAPGLLLLLALGVVATARFVPRLGPLLAAALLVYIVGLWLHIGWQQKTQPMKYDLRAGVHTIAERRAPDALLLLQIPHLEWAYRYYTSDFGPRPFTDSEARLAPWRGGLWTNHGWPDDVTQQDVVRQMAEFTAGFTEVWVLRSEVEMWDRRGFMEQWLQTHATLVEQADFHGVQVRQYQLPAAP